MLGDLPLVSMPTLDNNTQGNRTAGPLETVKTQPPVAGYTLHGTAANYHIDLLAQTNKYTIRNHQTQRQRFSCIH